MEGSAPNLGALVNEGEVKDPLLMILSWASAVQERDGMQKSTKVLRNL